MDDEKAIEWFEKAAEQGFISAQQALGVMYEHGFGADQDDSMAMRWYGKAAAQGHNDAQANIDYILAKRRASAATATESLTPSGEHIGEQEEQKLKSGEGKK